MVDGKELSTRITMIYRTYFTAHDKWRVLHSQ